MSDPEHVAGAVRAAFAGAGQQPTARSQTGRLKIQKVVYLLKRLGYAPADEFEFRIYLHGPYSHELAESYSDTPPLWSGGAPAARDVPEATREIIADALQRGPDFLEGLTTTIDGLPEYKDSESALRWAQSLKPHITDDVWMEVRIFLRENPSLIDFT